MEPNIFLGLPKDRPRNSPLQAARFHMNVKSKPSVVGLPALSLPWVKSCWPARHHPPPSSWMNGLARGPQRPLFQCRSQTTKLKRSKEAKEKTLFFWGGQKIFLLKGGNFCKRKKSFPETREGNPQGGKQKHKTTCF